MSAKIGAGKKRDMADDSTRNESYTPQISELGQVGTPKLLNMFFIVDISGSMMSEGRIGAVNEAFTKMIPILREIQIACTSEFELRLSILTFSNTAQWLVPPTPIMEYNHQEIQCTKWQTFYSKAFEEFGTKLTRSAYMAHTGKIAEPYIMFMTDGIPSGGDDYQPALQALLRNGWFKMSHRFAVLIGKDAINSPAARAAVGGFVTDPREGIINAADASAIAEEVQAKTIHTIEVKTGHAVAEDKPIQKTGGGGGIFDVAAGGGQVDAADIFDGLDFL